MGADIFFCFEHNDGRDWKRIVLPIALEPDDRNYALFEWLQNEAPFRDRGKLDDADSSIYIGDFGFTYFYLDEIQHVDWELVRDIEDHSLKGCYFQIFFEHVLPRFTDCLTLLKQRSVRIRLGFNR